MNILTSVDERLESLESTIQPIHRETVSLNRLVIESWCLSCSSFVALNDIDPHGILCVACFAIIYSARDNISHVQAELDKVISVFDTSPYVDSVIREGPKKLDRFIQAMGRVKEASA